jgi:hypothetical protein
MKSANPFQTIAPCVPRAALFLTASEMVWQERVSHGHRTLLATDSVLLWLSQRDFSLSIPGKLHYDDAMEHSLLQRLCEQTPKSALTTAVLLFGTGDSHGATVDEVARNRVTCGAAAAPWSDSRDSVTFLAGAAPHFPSVLTIADTLQRCCHQDNNIVRRIATNAYNFIGKSPNFLKKSLGVSSTEKTVAALGGDSAW